MAADVSSLVRLMNGYKEDQQPQEAAAGGGGGAAAAAAAKSRALITRDLLGGCCSTLNSTELDLDLQVPSGWEKRLDLKSGKVYLHRCNSPDISKNTNKSSSPSENKHQRSDQTMSKLEDLNLPPTSRKPLNLFDDGSCLDLKLVSSSSLSSSPTSSNNYQSVCTLDKVKTALERAEKETNKKRSMSLSNSLSPHSNSSSSGKDSHELVSGVDSDEKSSASFAAGCPSCLLYVLISKSNPKCPGCNTVVPSSLTVAKKPRIDLNISI